MKKKIGSVLFSITLLSGVSCSQNISENNEYKFLVEKTKTFVKSNDIDGFSVAIFTKDSIIWKNCTGETSTKQKINENTLFSIQSVSKNITATAVMIAVQEGLIDLNKPVIEYLPELNLNSCFEENPENKITLHMILSHTAGFAHEAPIGNNYDFSFNTNEEHLQSINNTWMKLPVGKDYFYSNNGFDLAAQIIEKVTGIPFNDYLKKKIFEPIGMESTTIDNNEILNNLNKTCGKISGAVKTKFYKTPLIGSGAVYTNLSDYIKYVQFEMNWGKLNQKQLVEPNYLLDMFTIRFNNYGLGTYIGNDNKLFYINHNGAGFGYSSTMLWFPEYEIGCVVMCTNQTYCFPLAFEISSEFIKNNKLPKVNSEVIDKFIAANKNYFNNPELINNVKLEPCSGDTIFNNEWKKYTGTYKIVLGGAEYKWFSKLAFKLGYIAYKMKVIEKNDKLYISGYFGVSMLREYKPGIFFTQNNDVLDFTKISPRFKNIELEKK
ncbi:MAG: hypothetical protein A2041_11000 [Bacteroidetes bacterium GWA2_31_9b]|nr:MAG: hypothetical protein A2041_11000 [Bacteroidetes bacterium GWA2_31_9b]